MTHIVDPADALYRERDEAVRRLQERIEASTDPEEVRELRREIRRTRRDFAAQLFRVRLRGLHTHW